MNSPITWLWNIKHRKLVEETKVIIRLHQFLRYECGLKYADKLSAKDFRVALSILSKPAK